MALEVHKGVQWPVITSGVENEIISAATKTCLRDQRMLLLLDCRNVPFRSERCVIGDSDLIFDFAARMRARRNALISKTVSCTPVRVARSVSEATRGSLRNNALITATDRREGRSPARSTRTLTGRTRSKLPASQAHRLLVALAARKYNSFTPSSSTLFVFSFNNYINNTLR